MQYCTLSLYKFLSKNNKIPEEDKITFYAITVHEGQNLNLLYLMSQKYCIFCSKKLHTDRIQHCLYHIIII
jgi:hypothetical protein